jgi:putative transposase
MRKVRPDLLKRLHRHRPRPGDTWHLDEVFIRIGGVYGAVLDILAQVRRNGAAGELFFKYPPLGLWYSASSPSVSAALAPLIGPCFRMSAIGTSRYLNNCAYNSYWPTRRRVRQMRLRSDHDAIL